MLILETEGLKYVSAKKLDHLLFDLKIGRQWIS